LTFRPHHFGADGSKEKTSTRKKENTMNTLEFKGDWNIAKGKLKQKWANLTDDDLQYVEGKYDETLGRIQKRTGEKREAVEQALNDSAVHYRKN
jgi:uncharacterized protein YjbJ (UPF0337 family)